MGHGIDMSNGRANMFYYGDVPWHSRGKPVAGALTAEEAIEAAGLDFEVKLLPTYTTTGDSGLIPIPNNFAVTRMDTEAPLSVVGSKYVPIQNKQCFEFLDSVVGPENLIEYHTAGSLYGGKKIWLLAKLTGLTVDIVPNDTLTSYLALVKGHDGQTPMYAFWTTTRIVCQNTANAALQDASRKKDKLVRIRHTRSAQDKVQEAKRILGFTIEQAEANIGNLKRLARKQMGTAAWEDFLDNLFPLPELDEGVETSRGLTIATKKRELLTELYESGAGTDIVGVRGTAWGAYNAVTELTTHHARVRTGVDKESKGYEQARAENLLHSSWFGTSAKINQRALELLSA